MEVRVLGAHGGESPWHQPTCLLVDDALAIDAGSLCRGLTLQEQARVDHIIVGHSHMDHIKDLGLLAEQVLGRRSSPVAIHCGPKTAKALRSHYFNGVLWPDFTALPTRSAPAMRLHTHVANRKFKLAGRYGVTLVPVKHPVESMGVVLADGGGAMLFSGDTGCTDQLWRLANKVDDLKAVFLEVSFPNSMQELADKVGHLTPFTLSLELEKLKQPSLAVFVYHIKPVWAHDTLRDLRNLRLDTVHVVSQGDRIAI